MIWNWQRSDLKAREDWLIDGQKSCYTVTVPVVDTELSPTQIRCGASLATCLQRLLVTSLSTQGGILCSW